jgi:hypothetical protein
MNLNIGDQNQFYQCAAILSKKTYLANKYNDTQILPRICHLSKKLNNPQASGAATENESSQETKFSELQMESSTHIINVTSTSMPEMNPTLAFVNLKVATNKWANSTEIRASFQKRTKNFSEFSSTVDF